MRFKLFNLWFILAFAGPALAQPSGGVAVSQVSTVRATVENVDQRTRQVLLRDEEGGLETVVAGPRVLRLAELRPGDVVVLEYGEAIAVSLASAADGAPPAEGGVAAARAGAHQAPGGAVAGGVRARVTIDAVDARTGTVTFTGPKGIQRRVRPREPEMIAFARGLRRGQQVDIAYGEVVAVRLEPVRR